MNIPYSISLAFILITLTTVFILFVAGKKNIKILAIVGLYLLIHGTLSYIGFYQTKPILPPKFFMVVAPSFALILYLLISKRGKSFIKTFDLRTLTLLHTIRIPVELILYSLFTAKAIPEVMTFAGRNFDIIAGLTAPIIYYLAFVKNRIGPKFLMLWNILCAILLINIVIHATLSVELPFQQFGFEQPNQAILQFPFTWLPSVVVPIVLFAHFASIQRLLKLKP
jgi:hypothetical protein